MQISGTQIIEFVGGEDKVKYLIAKVVGETQRRIKKKEVDGESVPELFSEIVLNWQLIFPINTFAFVLR